MIKVINTTEDNKFCNFDFYYLIPSGNNSANKTWAEAIAVDGRYNVATINSVNYIVVRKQLRFTSIGITNAQRLTQLAAENTRLTSEFQATLASELKFTGYEVA